MFTGRTKNRQGPIAVVTQIILQAAKRRTYADEGRQMKYNIHVLK
jgi:hypothetical protein